MGVGLSSKSTCVGRLIRVSRGLGVRSAVVGELGCEESVGKFIFNVLGVGQLLLF